MRSIMLGSPGPQGGRRGPGEIHIDSLPDRKCVEDTGARSRSRSRSLGIVTEVDDHVNFVRLRPGDFDGRGTIDGAFTQDISDAPRRLDIRPDRADDDPITESDAVDVPRPEG